MLFSSKNTFFSNSTFSLVLDYLVIAGGGSGANAFPGSYWGNGAGGAGGYVSGSYTARSPFNYIITVGAGGTPPAVNTGGNGTLSSISSGLEVSATGGGGGGLNGGSGGGSHYIFAVGTGIAGQGFDGANGPGDAQMGGGGGAGQAGATGATTAKGGDGLTWLDGVTRAGGGGGSRWINAGGALSGAGGAGGGGRGANSNTTPAYVAENGTINTGSGGGVGFAVSGYALAGSGGSGIVILRYSGIPKATGGTITQSGGYTYHTFNSSGTFSI
jgi:hypothetical protein